MNTKSVLELRPTQFVLGMKEIESKTAKMRNFTNKELKSYCLDHVIPVIVGPGHQHYLIDHHHFLRACWELGIESYKTQVIRDLSHVNETAFWNYMIKKDWCYLHDQFGLGPHPPALLPMDIRCMADDPYRSLAWALREEKLILKQSVPFFEFKWAAFLRHNLTVRLRSKSDFSEAIAEARKLVKSKAAKYLPGYAFKK